MDFRNRVTHFVQGNHHKNHNKIKGFMDGGKVKKEEYKDQGKRSRSSSSDNSSSSADSNNEMQRLMGFGGFGSTKGKSISDQSKGGISKKQKPQSTSPLSSDSDIYDDAFIAHIIPHGTSPTSEDQYTIDQFKKKNKARHSTLKFTDPSAFKRYLKSPEAQNNLKTGETFLTDPFEVEIREVRGNPPIVELLSRKERRLEIAGNPSHVDKKGRTKVRHYHGVPSGQR